jgi:single-stranded DNA-specific DHH superfamily exonuclease
MLTEKEIKQLRDELVTAKHPIFFFHDDPDGLASFLLLYRMANEGKGVVVKASPRLAGNIFASKVDEYGADKVFVLDLATVEQEFIDAVKVPVVWIDHHAPLQRENVRYFNPKTRGEGTPVAYLCWQISQEQNPQDLWIAMAGCIGDWFMPDSKIVEKFREQYPELLPAGIKKAEDALFAPDSKLGLLVKILSFNLKGSTGDTLKAIKILTRVENPNEILNQESPRGKLIFKNYENVNYDYENLKAMALKAEAKSKKDRLLMFTYAEDRLSLTKDLANELLYMFPEKVILLGREKSGEMRCSLRSGTKINLLEGLTKALVGIEGYGGGHEHACGAAIKKHDFERFVENLRKELDLQFLENLPEKFEQDR